jgi:uncharacterized protein YcbK (DUF882 family)
MKIQDINPENIKNFIQGNYLMVKDILGSDKMSHVKEQALYRAMLCPQCLIAGRCIKCGCKTPNMFYSPEKKCNNYKWHTMLPKEYWEEYKKIHNIELIKTFEEIMSDEMKSNLKHFSPSEFVMGGENVFDKMNTEFLVKLDELREKVGQPISLLSSYRSPEYNAKIGGVKRSFHLLGRAVDIKCPSSQYRAAIMKEALNMGLTVGVMRTALHIDNRNIADQKVFHYYPRYGSNDVENEYNG